MSVYLFIASMAAILVLFIASVDSSQDISSSNKHYSIQIDAGSQGTRVYVYQYDAITNTNVDDYTAPEKTLIQLGNKRVKPGISSFWNRTATPDGLTRTIQSLVDYAKSLIPLSEVHKTPISLKATAGLRVLPELHQAAIISEVFLLLQNSGFVVSENDVGIISGKEESMYAYFAIKTVFPHLINENSVVGVTDMGGVSCQLSFLYNIDHNGNDSSDSSSRGGDSVPHSCSPDWEINVGGNNKNNNDDFNSGITQASTDRDVELDGKVVSVATPSSSHSLQLFAKSTEGMGLIAAMDSVVYSYYYDFACRNDLISNVVLESSLDDLKNIIDIFRENNLCKSRESEGFGGDRTIVASHDGSVSTSEVSADPEGNAQIGSIQLSPFSHKHPCLSYGSVPYELDGRNLYNFHGSGDFVTCVDSIRFKLGQKMTSNIDHACLRGKTDLFPKIFIGIENFAKVLQVAGIPNGKFVSPADIKKHGIAVCSKSWQDIMENFAGESIPTYRAWRACFATAFIYTTLTDVYGIDEYAPEFVAFESFNDWHELNWSIGAASMRAMNAKAVLKSW